jgi:prevent-host-death family protein
MRNVKSSLSKLHTHTADVINPVKQGHAVTLTERGKPIALITPLPKRGITGPELAERMKKYEGPEWDAAFEEMADIIEKNRGVR